MALAAAWEQRNDPLRFTSWTASQSSSVSSRNGTRGKIPALLTKPVSPPEPPSSTPAATIFRTAPASVTLPRTRAARAPAAATSSATARAPASSSSQLTTTFAPSRAAARAIAAPDPLLCARHRNAHRFKAHASPPPALPSAESPNSIPFPLPVVGGRDFDYIPGTDGRLPVRRNPLPARGGAGGALRMPLPTLANSSRQAHSACRCARRATEHALKASGVSFQSEIDTCTGSECPQWREHR